MPFEPLPDELASALDRAAPRLGTYAALHFQREVESTNDVAFALAAAGAPEGTSVTAERQRQGRGRRGHAWYSPAGRGVYLSVVLRPDSAHGFLPLLTLGAGVAMAEAVRAVSALPVELRWPNDLMIGRPWRKIGGVLAEASSSGTRTDAVIAGIGINVTGADYPPELAARATSVEAEVGRSVNRALLTVELLCRLRDVMSHLRAADYQDVANRWRDFAARGLHAPVSWQDESGPRRGVAVDIDESGALLVDVGGRVERVTGGVVTWAHDVRK